MFFCNFLQTRVSAFLDINSLLSLKLTCWDLYYFRHQAVIPKEYAAIHMTAYLAFLPPVEDGFLEFNELDLGDLLVSTLDFKEFHFENGRKIDRSVLRRLVTFDDDPSLIVSSIPPNSDYGKCCPRLYTLWNPDVLKAFSLRHLTHLNLVSVDCYFDNLFHHSCLNDSYIDHLTNLVFLNMGHRNGFTNRALRNMSKLETLYLENNRAVTNEIFSFLKNLKCIQISDQSHIDEHIARQHVETVVIYTFEYICQEQCVEFRMD